MHHTADQGAGDVLIVEDDEPIIVLLDELLTDAGYHVRTARDAAAAWSAVEAAAPALLLLDILLPGSMDGADLARKLRAEGYSVPIIIIAATEHLAQPILTLGRIAYVGKPFDLEVLLTNVARYLAPKR